MANCEHVYTYGCELKHGHTLPHVSPLEEARAEVERLHAASIPPTGQIDYTKLATAAWATNRRLRAQLRQYGEHEPDCRPVFLDKGYDPCSCGLTSALEGE